MIGTDRGIAEHDEGGAYVVALLGDHDLASSGDLAERLCRLLDSGLQLVVDLSEARFIDSSIVGALFVAWERAESRPEQRMALVLPLTGPVAHVLELTQIETIIPSFPTRAEAVAALGQQPV